MYRSGFDAAGLPAVRRFGSRRIVRLGRRFPQLFFLFVLGGSGWPARGSDGTGLDGGTGA